LLSFCQLVGDYSRDHIAILVTLTLFIVLFLDLSFWDGGSFSEKHYFTVFKYGLKIGGLDAFVFKLLLMVIEKIISRNKYLLVYWLPKVIRADQVQACNNSKF